LPLTLTEVLDTAVANSSQAKADAAAVSAFLTERVEFYLREVKGQAYDVVKAVLAGGTDDVRDAVARAEAVSSVRGEEDFIAVCAMFKRVANLLADTFDLESATPIEIRLFVEPAEHLLYEKIQITRPQWKAFISKGEYVNALSLIASLKDTLDQFFTDVIVMTDNAEIKRNRISLLMKLLVTFRQVADFSEIVS
jgi:glycyl-tRNA synthetase beta chain